MKAFVARRILEIILTLLVVSILMFFLARLSGDPIALLMPVTATEEDYEREKKKWGLDKPFLTQYIAFIGNALKGDFGKSIKTNHEVGPLIASKLLNSAKLSAFGFLVALLISVPLAVYSAVKKDSILDHFVRGFAAFGQGIPVFWSGIILMYIFSIKLNWLPATGMGGITHYILPGFLVAWFLSAGFIRLIRSSMLDVLDSEYVKFARINGLSERSTIWKHALRNSLLPFIGFGGVWIAVTVTSSVVTEVVFAWPGFGRLVYDAIMFRDYPLMQGVIMTGAFIIAMANFMVDLLYAVFDPRIRYT